MEKDLDRILNATDKQFSKLNRLLYNVILDYFVGGLLITDNKVELNESNRRLVASLDRNTDFQTKSIFTEFKRFVQANIMKYIFKGLANLTKIDVRATETSDTVIDKINKHSATVLDVNLSLEKLYLEVKERSIRLMSKPEGISLRELRENLKDFVVDKGLTERYYKRWTYDIYSQYERVASNEVRKGIGLKFAIYQGGLIKDSRPFCIQRNNKCYSEKEIMSWKDLSWIGKPESGYDVITDLGGYNCRHRLDWISDVLAYRLRPDLDPKNKGKDIDVKLYNDVPEKKTKDKTITEKPVIERPIIKLGFDKKFDDYVNENNVPDLVKKVVNKVPKPFEIKSKGLRKGSYYTAGKFSRLVSEDKGGSNDFYHEYGHHIDMFDLKNKRSQSSKLNDAKNADVKNLTNFFGKNILSSFVPIVKGKNNLTGISDIVDALSAGVFHDKYKMAGHGRKYYKRNNTINEEIYANAFELISTNNKESIELFEKYFPNIKKFILEDLEEILK